jgi:hypothetical protein
MKLSVNIKTRFILFGKIASCCRVRTKTAVVYLREGKINETAQLIGHIRIAFNQIMDEMVKLRQPTNEVKINGYLKSIESRLEALGKQADKAPEPQTSTANGLLDDAEARLNAARGKSGQEAISLLNEAQSFIDQAKDALHRKP